MLILLVVDALLALKTENGLGLRTFFVFKANREQNAGLCCLELLTDAEPVLIYCHQLVVHCRGMASS